MTHVLMVRLAQQSFFLKQLHKSRKQEGFPWLIMKPGISKGPGKTASRMREMLKIGTPRVIYTSIF
jgi:hypothetical protein